MMEQILAKTSQHVQPLWQKSRWYHAITLSERIASLQAHATLPQTMCGTEKAQRRLQQWKEQAPFHTGSFFAERLAMDSLTEDDLLALLAEPIEAVQARIGISPEWLMELRQAFEDYDPTGDRSLPVRNAEDSRHLFSFLNVIKPLLLRSLDRLGTGIQDLAQKYTYLPFDSQTIVPSLFAALPPQILPQLSRTLVLELNVARLQGHLQGDTPEERFEDFVQQLSQGKMLPLLEEYTVLARQLVMAIDQWIVYSLEFLRHLCADWEQICAVFTPESDPGVLVAVQGGAGDTHRGGRSVMILRFRSGFQLVYKPKSLAIDVHFQQLLAWLNERGQQLALRTLKLMDKGSYGWSEFISACDCTLVEQVERFYERQGAYLALLYALKATDFHSENIIAAGEHPMLIDLEALFCPEVGKDDQAISVNPAYQPLVHSVLRIGLLPQRLWSNDNTEGIDISGLGGQEGQLSPRPVSTWEEAGTDQMRVVRQRVQMPVGNNRPRLNGCDIDTLNYRDSVITGFTRMYQLLREHRDELVTELLSHFAQDEIRFIARATNTYGLLLADSFHPNMLRDALKRDRLFDRLWLSIDRRPYLSRIIAAERADLLRGDIPMFITRPNSRDLFTSQREQITEFFEEPGLESVKQRIQQLDEHDQAQQIWLIQASFTSMSMGMEQVTRKVRQLQPAHTRVTRERLVAAASAVGEHLCNLALRNEDAVGWLGVAPVNEREWHLLPSDTGLYDGTTGITFFLAYLGAVTGKAHYIEMAEAALKSVHYMLEQQKSSQDFEGIGAFKGLGSPIYLLSHLGILWNQPALIHEVEELVKFLPALIEKEDELDIIGGSAGCILSLLSLYAVAPSSRTLAAAIQCGDHLIARAQPMKEGVGWKTMQQEIPLGGFSHGATGMAFSLLKLADISGEERFRQTALAAMMYERSLFSPSRQNWLDLRADPTSTTVSGSQIVAGENNKFMMAWCHGAPGIGLGRLGSLHYMEDATIRQEIDIALKTTLAEGFGRNHSLCHGDFGNLETLLMATSILDEPRYREQLERITARLLESIDSSGWITGVPLGVETPGLMTGLAGIGYELLRLAAPEQVPSVLLLAPPNSANPNRARK